ncbi:GxxExxY protein [Candidatus Falkowbacteria bacterium CG10_big_fil_rev_8_21_14_0_10_44_15]|uniref:GxxExxY protein n=1 Tax=Candidatus Falkowbacteria bacterium CG10_big_fil_rev_8_21_14_0_10_44_15 TaxID=1974569 RepID=A0A2H0V169_9BACT|nr:MAG: GxxExxY protein [Candidatus Falkowbacteria bacterium CG10_big_fil_rev_8_21_14_0_10_44_15]
MFEEQKNKVIYPELSYRIIGTLFEVYNELGAGYKEKYYERAVVKSLTNKKIIFLSQVPYKIRFQGEIIGINYLDFLIENKIILELKKGDYFSKHNIDQVNAYLKVTGLKLAILAQFTSQGVRFIRLLNMGLA